MAPYHRPMAIDVTDMTFEAEVIERSRTTPVVIDLWAPWCNPCVTLGPIIERVVDETEGRVVLAKVNIDENPAVAQAFRVQSIPAVFAVVDGQVVDNFLGAQPEGAVREFVAKLDGGGEPSFVDMLREIGDETALRQALEHEPDNEAVIVDLAELLIGEEREEEATALLARIPESAETRRLMALIRTGGAFLDDDELESRLETLLETVKDDDAARQEFVDLLELLGAEDPRTAGWRRRLTNRLF